MTLKNKIALIFCMCLLFQKAFSQKESHVLLGDRYPFIESEDSTYYKGFIDAVYDGIGDLECCDTSEECKMYCYEYIFREEMSIYPKQYSVGDGFSPDILNMTEVFRDMLSGDSHYFARDLIKILKRNYGNLKKFKKACYDFSPVVRSIRNNEDMLEIMVDFNFTICFQR